MTQRPLTVGQAVNLAAIVEAAIHNQRVAWLLDNGDVIWGTARSIGDQRGNLAGPDEDIRDCWLRVTTSSGMEAFLPMADVLRQHHDSTFVTNYQP